MLHKANIRKIYSLVKHAFKILFKGYIILAAIILTLIILNAVLCPLYYCDYSNITNKNGEQLNGLVNEDASESQYK